MTTTKHEDLLELAAEAVDRLFGDTSVSQEQTRESLEELKSKIESMLATLETGS